jgi:hypothetical protein
VLLFSLIAACITSRGIHDRNGPRLSAESNSQRLFFLIQETSGFVPWLRCWAGQRRAGSAQFRREQDARMPAGNCQAAAAPLDHILPRAGQHRCAARADARKGTRFGIPMLQLVIVGKPEGSVANRAIAIYVTVHSGCTRSHSLWKVGGRTARNAEPVDPAVRTTHSKTDITGSLDTCRPLTINCLPRRHETGLLIWPKRERKDG